MGNRVYKSTYDGSATTGRKYIVDIHGKLPTIVCELDTSGSLEKSYIYANAQILAQRAHEADPNFYDESYFVHDRLGSVRLVVDYNDIDEYICVANSYTYTPFGQFYGTPDETVDNPFKFTGQWHDAEINQYYLRARMYDPTMMRFTSRDPVRGERNEPLTLHRYLYCINSPTKYIDPSGEFSMPEVLTGMFIQGAVGGMSGILGYTSHMLMLEGTGIEMSKEDEFLLFCGYVVGGAVSGAVTGGASTAVHGLGAAFPSALAIGAWQGGGIASGTIMGMIHKNVKGPNKVGALNSARQGQLMGVMNTWF